MRSRSVWLFAAVSAIGLSTLLLAGYLLSRGIDLGAYRPEIIAQVRVATGRTFEMGERLELGYRNGIVVRARNLVLGNTDWGSRPHMLQVKQAELRLALLPLLTGELRVQHIGLKNLDLFLETDGYGKGNWQFDAGAAAAGESPGVNVDSFTIESGSIAWRNQGSRPSGAIQLADFRLAATDDGTMLTLKADARLAGQTLQLIGRATSPHRWRSGQPLDVNAQLKTQAGAIRLEGAVEQTAQGIRSMLQLTAEELDVAALAQLTGHEIPALPKLDVDLDLNRDAEAWQIDIHTAKAGNSDLHGSLHLETAANKPRLSGTLSAKTLELGELLPRSVEKRQAVQHERRIFSPMPLDLRLLRELDVNLQFRADDLAMPGQRFSNAQLKADLMDGQLRLELDGAAGEGHGRLRGHVELDARTEVPIWSINLALTRYPASALQRAAALTLVDAPADLSLHLKARGASPRAMAESLSGKVRLVVGRGRARLKTVDSLVGGLSTVAGQLFEQGTTDTRLNCMIGDVSIERGIATTRVALIDSTAATLRADGKLDLGAEQINLTVTPRPKRPTLTVAVPVHVRGPLINPQFKPDRTSSLAKLVGVAGLFVYPPAAIVALGDLGDSGNTCAKMLQGAAAPEPKGSPVQQVKKGIGDAAGAISRGLGRLFGG